MYGIWYGILEWHCVGVPTYSGAYAIHSINQALKACYKFKYNIKMFSPFWIGCLYNINILYNKLKNMD